MSKLLTDILSERARAEANHLAFKFITDTTTQTVTYQNLCHQAQRIAAVLQKHQAWRKRALIVLPPGLEYIYAFFGCLYAGVIAVPLYPPRNNHHRQRLQTILHDARADFVITLQAIETRYSFPGTVLCLDNLDNMLADDYESVELNSSDLAFLQYTSGSTDSPKGVMINHGNLLANSACMEKLFAQEDYQQGAAFWVPPYHDMGLIGSILYPVYKGFLTRLMSPSYFIQDPLRWLTIISTERVLLSAAPDFAYDLCSSISPEKIAHLDLSCWKIAVNGAEPVREETIQKFSERFASVGFDQSAFMPCFGLAESTLIATGQYYNATDTLHLDKIALEKRIVKQVIDEANGPVYQLVSCGKACADHDVFIVKPEDKQLLPAESIGEIWLRGPSIAEGYSNKPEINQDMFHAYTTTGLGPCLRTGDLGFLDKQNNLYVTGRLKDLIIINARNFHPHDIEATIVKSHEALIPHGGAAFSIQGEHGEVLVIVQEIHRHQKDTDTVIKAIRHQVFTEHDLIPSNVVLIMQATLPKTSSGKIQRLACRKLFLEKKLKTIATWSAVHMNEDIVEGLEQLLQIKIAAMPDDTLLAALGANSLLFVELQIFIHTKTSRTIPLAQLSSMTVGELKTLNQPLASYPEHSDKGSMIASGNTEHQHSGQKILRKIIQLPCRLLFKTYCPVTCEGIEHLPKEGPFLLCANQSSHLDILALIHASKRDVNDFIAFTAKDHLDNTWMNRLKRVGLPFVVDYFPIDRHEGSGFNWDNVLVSLKPHLDNKKILTIFPEGTRTKTGQMQEFKSGVAYLAHQLGLPVVPAHIHGTWHCLPYNKSIPGKGKISIAFGKPLEFANEQHELNQFSAYQEFTKKLYQEVVRLGS